MMLPHAEYTLVSEDDDGVRTATIDRSCGLFPGQQAKLAQVDYLLGLVIAALSAGLPEYSGSLKILIVVRRHIDGEARFRGGKA